MKYSWEFKLECVKNYQIGKSNVKPECAKCNQKEFSHKVREWVSINVNIIMYRFDQLRMYNQDILNWLFFSNIFITLL